MKNTPHNQANYKKHLLVSIIVKYNFEDLIKTIYSCTKSTFQKTKKQNL
jgi:hypothetical protein